MEIFVANTSRWRLIPTMICLAFFLSVSVCMMLGLAADNVYEQKRNLYLGSLALSCSLIMSEKWIRRLVRSGEQLRIAAEGIRWAPWSDHTISWQEIKNIQTSKLSGPKSIVLTLRKPSHFPGRKYLSLQERIDQLFTRGDVVIELRGTDRRFGEAMAAIIHFRS
jgi:hypothetical protein